MLLTRSEKRAMERAKEKHVAKLMASGYDQWIDITAREQTKKIIENFHGEKPVKVWQNGCFIVQAFETPNQWHAIRVMVRWLDARPDHDWALFQRIKNDLFGPERVALEVYPAESNKQDVANMYWFWVLPEGFDCPVEIKRRHP